MKIYLCSYLSLNITIPMRINKTKATRSKFYKKLVLILSSTSKVSKYRTPKNTKVQKYNNFKIF